MRWTVVSNCDSFFITKCDTVDYNLRQVLQSAMDLLQIATGITKCDDYYKLRQYMVALCAKALSSNYKIGVKNNLSKAQSLNKEELTF